MAAGPPGSVSIERVLVHASMYRGQPEGPEIGERYQQEYGWTHANQ